MYLRDLHIRNLKLLRDVHIPFTDGNGEPRKWTVLLGKNGLCKTSILQSIALISSGQRRAQQLANIPSLRDRRSESSTVEIQAEFGFSQSYHAHRTYPDLDPKPPEPPRLTAKLFLFPGESDFRGTSDFPDHASYLKIISISPGFPIPVHDPLSDARSQQLNHWFVAGYGVNRALSDRVLEKAPEDLALFRLESLFGKGSLIGTGFTDLFQDVGAKEAVLPAGSKATRTGPFARAYAKTLQKIFVSPHGLLPQIGGIDLRGKHGVRRARDLIESRRFDFLIDGQEVRVPATWLSQGYQGTIAWIADLVGQIFWEADGLVEAEEMEGIVLLDEIDLHLHPSWQVRLVNALKHTFPKLQFITTTHSPMILPYVRQEELFLVVEDGNGNVTVRASDQSPMLMTGSQIYDVFFGIDQVFPSSLRDDVRRYGFLAGDPFRSETEDQELRVLKERLEGNGIKPDWQPLPRQDPQDATGMLGSTPESKQ